MIRRPLVFALALALLPDPDLMVLDEPTTGMDVTARQEMRRLVARRCAEEGLTLLLVTHDVLDLTALAEDVVVLDRGRVVEQGPTARVLSAPGPDGAPNRPVLGTWMVGDECFGVGIRESDGPVTDALCRFVPNIIV